MSVSMGIGALPSWRGARSYTASLLAWPGRVGRSVDPIQAAVQRVPATGADPAREARGGRPVVVVVAPRGGGARRLSRSARGAAGMRIRPIHFVPDVDEALRFYRA